MILQSKTGQVVLGDSAELQDWKEVDCNKQI